MNEKILDKIVFVLEGVFPEVNDNASAAINSISNMIQRFGGKVHSRMSKGTRKYSIYSLRLRIPSLTSHTLMSCLI